MSEDRDRFRHNVSRYERPTKAWRCGRGAAWRRPCPRGPSDNGACGGTSQCMPELRRGAWTCRRAEALGGACSAGPDARGRCGETLPPCAPVPTIAVWRFRLSLAAAVLVIAVVAALGIRDRPLAVQLAVIDPGPVTAAHAQFVGAQNCAGCHAAHAEGWSGWWQALARPATVAQSCTNCHGFGGHEGLAHNRVRSKPIEARSMTCVSCHAEHRGADAPVTTMTDVQCTSCHEVKVPRFADGHPPFPANFPYDHPSSIQFNHASHLDRHFTDPRLAAAAPKGCVDCHEPAEAARVVRPAGFEKTCAACHGEAIRKRDLVVFRLPEFPRNEIAGADVEAACGLNVEAAAELRAAVETGRPAAQSAGKETEPFSSVSADLPNVLTAYLVGIDPVDPEAYGGPIQALIRDMMEVGTEPLAKLILSRAGEAPIERLLAGLGAETVQRAACAWAANREHQAPGKAPAAGWKADALELRYSAAGHADPVLKAWLEFAANAPAGGGTAGLARTEALRKELFSPTEGVGSCAKCHIGLASAGAKPAAWTYRFGDVRPHTRFNHRPHVDLLGPEKTCTTCHQRATPMPATGPAGVVAGAFAPITVGACVGCHAAGKVDDGCRTCHVYHQNHVLMKRMAGNAR